MRVTSIMFLEDHPKRRVPKSLLLWFYASVVERRHTQAVNVNQSWRGVFSEGFYLRGTLSLRLVMMANRLALTHLIHRCPAVYYAVPTRQLLYLSVHL